MNEFDKTKEELLTDLKELNQVHDALKISYKNDILDRKRKEELIRESEKKYRMLIENMGEGVGFLNDEEIFVYANPSAEKIFGVGKGELTGLCLNDFLFGENIEIVRNEKKIFHRGESSTYELQIFLKDGSKKDILSTATPNFDGKKFLGIYAIFRDISNRKRTENALRESEALYRNLVERLPDGVYKSTHDGKLVEANPAMIKILGYENKEELMAIDIKTQLYFEPTDRDSLVLQEKLEEMGVFRMKKKDGSCIWVEDHGWYTMDENGAILFHEGILRDVTDRKKAEEATSMLIQSEKMASLGMLTAGIAHEINNPINFINSGAISLQKDYEDLEKIINAIDQLPPQAQKLADELGLRELMKIIPQTVEDIKIGVQRTSEIVKGLRNFTRMGASELQESDLYEGINSTLLLLDHKFKDRIIVINDYDDRIGLIKCYPGPLNQVFMNLLNNAIDAIDQKIKEHPVTDGQYQIGITTQLTEVGLKKQVNIVITDNGTGIPDEIKDKLFDPFFTTKEVGKGTGLGLSICHGIIEKHGGSITFESKVNEGSAFTITVPVD